MFWDCLLWGNIEEVKVRWGGGYRWESLIEEMGQCKRSSNYLKGSIGWWIGGEIQIGLFQGDWSDNVLKNS